TASRRRSGWNTACQLTADDRDEWPGQALACPGSSDMGAGFHATPAGWGRVDNVGPPTQQIQDTSKPEPELQKKGQKTPGCNRGLNGPSALRSVLSCSRVSAWSEMISELAGSWRQTQT